MCNDATLQVDFLGQGQNHLMLSLQSPLISKLNQVVETFLSELSRPPLETVNQGTDYTLAVFDPTMVPH